MPQSLGFHAWISIGDDTTATLPEYGVETDEGAKRVTCWIPSETDQTFSVNWKTANHPSPTTGDVVIDGIKSGGKVLRLHHRNITTSHAGAPISATSARPFVFSSLELTDDDRYRNNAGCKDLGEIKLIISEIFENGEGGPPNTTLPDEQKVHEQDKKAMAHRVKFGDAKTLDVPVRFVNVLRLAEVVTFVFKYRSLDILQANGIAPPKPLQQGQPRAGSSGERAGSAEDEEDEDNKVYVESDDEELKAALAKVEQVRAKRAAEGKLPKAKRVKAEQPARGPVFKPGEVIDLT